MGNSPLFWVGEVIGANIADTLHTPSLLLPGVRPTVCEEKVYEGKVFFGYIGAFNR